MPYLLLLFIFQEVTATSSRSRPEEVLVFWSTMA